MDCAPGRRPDRSEPLASSLRRPARATCAALAIITCSLATSPVSAGPAPPAAAPATHPLATNPLAATSAALPQAGGTPGTHALTARDLGAFLDGLVPYAIRRANIAGASVAVVSGGKLLFAKGYGFANVRTRAPVAANRTLFRAGSISKLFTWTAVMQLVQAGKINLDQNIDAYLGFRVPPKFGRPITMRDLMTHTPGFEDTISQMMPGSAAGLMPLREYLTRHMPARIFPPGKITAYSNFGATLAGYIVQRISGEPFDEYIERHIFQPLGMNHSTFEQPPPPALMAEVSQGYATASGKPKGFEYVEVSPAGALSTTATDMARFMIAQLGDGSDGGAPILDPQTLALMHSPQSRMAPGMNGFDLGFYQENRNGLAIIGHGGDTNWFHSDLHLLLGKQTGFFIALNSAGTGGAADGVRVAIFRAFLDRYFPYRPPAERTVPRAQARADAARVAGWYTPSRRIVSALRMLSAFTETPVTALSDGRIEIGMLTHLSGTPLLWREVGPLDYRRVGGQSHLKFVTDPSGRIRYWIADDFPPVFVLQRVHGLKKLSDLKAMLSVFCGVLILTLAIWLGGWIVRRRVGRVLELSRMQRQLRLASRFGALVLLAMIGGWISVVGLLLHNDWALNGPMIGAYVISVLGIVGALAIVAEAALRVWRGPGGWLARGGEALLGLCGLYGLWLIFAFGLANFSLRY
jgi:CubicO group peptidase (beta-lactamase class C family)